jgi:hypothetical protein
MIPSLLFSMLFPRFVLMPTSLDKLNHQQPAPPWVGAQVHAPLIRGYATTSHVIITRSLAKSITVNHCPPSTTIRVVEETLDPKPKPCSSSKASSTTTCTRDITPTPTPPSRTLKSLSFRNKDKMSSVLTTPTRLRGKTVPVPYTRERERDCDAESIISFTPSMSSKHIASWFSGLLGGG